VYQYNLKLIQVGEEMTWGNEAWGGEGIWEFVSVTGQQLNLTLNSVTPLANADVDVTGEQLNVTEGEVDPSVLMLQLPVLE
jgi:hypothetical protein